MRACATCRWWRQQGGSSFEKEGKPVYALCVRFPPVPDLPDSAVGVWPATEPTDYCGEWEIASGKC